MKKNKKKKTGVRLLIFLFNGAFPKLNITSPAPPPKKSHLRKSLLQNFTSPHQRANYHVAKYLPAKTLQLPASCSKKMISNVMEATILSGSFKGKGVLIPRILLIQSDMPFQFKILKFPIKLAFAISINKA